MGKRANRQFITRKDTLVKFVKRASMWCKTHWTDRGEQKQEWSIDKPDSNRPEST